MEHLLLFNSLPKFSCEKQKLLERNLKILKDSGLVLLIEREMPRIFLCLKCFKMHFIKLTKLQNCC